MQDLQPDLNPGMSQNQGIELPNGETDREGAMAKADLYKLATYSFKLFKKIQDEDQLEAWVQAKITKAADYIASVYHYLEYEMEFSEYGKKIDNSDVYNEDQKRELKNKLLEAKEMVKALKKKQADKLSGKNVEEGVWDKVKATGHDIASNYNKLKAVNAGSHMGGPSGAELEYSDKAKAHADKAAALRNKQTDVEEGQEELKKSGDTFKTQHGVATKTDTGIKHTRTSKPEDDEDYVPPKKPSKAAKSSAEKAGDRAADKEQNKKSKELNKKFPGTVRRYQDGKEVPIKEAKKSPKAKKDYDEDGKVETEKEEVIGSRRKAAGLDETQSCNETAKGKSCPVHGLKECPMEESAPSAGMTKKEKSAVVKKAKAGEDIGKPGKGFEKVEKAAKKSGAKDPKAVAAAAMWKSAKKKAVKESVEGEVPTSAPIPQVQPSADTETEGFEQLGNEASKIAKIFQDLQKNEPEKFAQAAAQGEEAMAQLVASKMNPTADATDAPMDADSAMSMPEPGQALEPLSESIDRIRFLSGLK